MLCLHWSVLLLRGLLRSRGQVPSLQRWVKLRWPGPALSPTHSSVNGLSRLGMFPRDHSPVDEAWIEWARSPPLAHYHETYLWCIAVQAVCPGWRDHSPVDRAQIKRAHYLSLACDHKAWIKWTHSPLPACHHEVWIERAHSPSPATSSARLTRNVKKSTRAGVCGKLELLCGNVRTAMWCLHGLHLAIFPWVSPFSVVVREPR